MISKSKVTVISTFAKDKLLDEKGEIASEQKGGPAYFITNVLKKESVLFDLKTSKEITVELLLKDGDEFGRIPEKITPMLIDFSKIKTPEMLISFVANQCKLESLQLYKGRVFLDIQGYVRNVSNFGKKKFWSVSKKISNNIFGLKAADYELKFIPKSIVEKQKKKLLIVTKGELGVEVYWVSERYLLRPKTIIKAKNTIGAGDTFFAYFVSRFTKTNNVKNSCSYALEKTSEFLTSKVSHHTNPF